MFGFVHGGIIVSENEINLFRTHAIIRTSISDG